LHSCFETQKNILEKLKKENNKFLNIDLENCNFFLPIYDVDDKQINKKNLKISNHIPNNRINKENYTTKNTLLLNSSYNNFVNSGKKLNCILPHSKDIGNKYDNGNIKNISKKNNTETSRKIDYENSNKIKYLFCLFCKKIYKNNSVLMYCDFCCLPYYTSLQEKENEFIHPATWEKYHCGAIVNDRMSCIKCNSYLNLNTKSNKLICVNCNFISDPIKVKWKCMICSEEFKSNAKIYNPLEYKLIKIAINDAVIYKIPIFPRDINCCINIREKIIKSSFNYKSENKPNKEQFNLCDNRFYMKHKKECQGELYEGVLYDRKIVVCGECKTFVNYEKFIWYCPYCDKKYMTKKYIVDDENNSDNHKPDNDKNTNNYSLKLFTENSLKIKEYDYKTKLDSSNKIISGIHNHKSKNYISEFNKEIMDNTPDKNKSANSNKNLCGNKYSYSNAMINNKNKEIDEKIDINNWNKPILKRLSHKIDFNITSNLNNFISKAVGMNKSLLLSNSNINSILDFNLNNFSDLKNSTFNLSNLDNININKLKNNISSNKDILDQKENYKNSETNPDDYSFNSSNSTYLNKSYLKNTILDNKQLDKGELNLISSNHLKVQQKIIKNEFDEIYTVDKIKEEYLDKNNVNKNIFEQDNKNSKRINQYGRLSISYFKDRKTQKINENNALIASKFKNNKEEKENNISNEYETIPAVEHRNEKYFESETEKISPQNKSDYSYFNMKENTKLLNNEMHISKCLYDNCKENKPKLTVFPNAKNPKNHFSWIFESKETKDLNLDKNLHIEIKKNSKNKNEDFSNNKTYIFTKNSLCLKKENEKSNHLCETSPNIEYNRIPQKEKDRICLYKKSFNLENFIESDTEKKLSTKNEFNQSRIIDNNIYVKPNLRLNYNKFIESSQLSVEYKNDRLNKTEYKTQLNKNQKIFKKNINNRTLANLKNIDTTDFSKTNILNNDKNKILDKNPNRQSPNSKTPDKLKDISNKYFKQNDLPSNIFKHGSNNSNNNLIDDSTSCITHHNKYINSYIHNKTLDNEIISNLNNNSNTLLNSECIYNSINIDNYPNEDECNQFLSKNKILRFNSISTNEFDFFKNQKNSINLHQPNYSTKLNLDQANRNKYIFNIIFSIYAYFVLIIIKI